MMRDVALVLGGAAVAVTLLLSCSDDSPTDADAAVCDCPTLTTVEDIRPDAGGAPGSVFAIARCPEGSMLVGGGCEAEVGVGQGDQFRLYQAGGRAASGPPVYTCRWDNPMGVTATVTAWATCQVP